MAADFCVKTGGYFYRGWGILLLCIIDIYLLMYILDSVFLQRHVAYIKKIIRYITPSTEVAFEYRGCGCAVPKNVTIVQFHSSVTEIDEWAFSCCVNLREVVLLHGVPRKIGWNAFYNCTSLERFTFPTISTRLDNLIQTGNWDEINNRVDTVRGVVEQSGGELFVSTQSMTLGNNRSTVYSSTVRKDLDKIILVISYYEIKEGTSIFELALWKFKLDQVDGNDPTTRKKCRMDVPGPAKDIIMQYLR